MKGYVALKRSSGKRGTCLYTNPLDTLNDYPLIDYRGDLIEAAKVETLTEPYTDDKKRFYTDEFAIRKKFSLSELVNEGVAFSSKEADTTCASAASSNGTLTSPYITASLASADSNSKLASSGHYAQLAASGDFSAIASSGRRACLASSGRYAMLASAGEGDKLVSAGDESRLVSLGDCAVIASLGFRGSVDIRGKDSVGAAVGRDNKIRGTIGTWITLAEWDFDDDDDTRYVCKCIKSAKIDGKKLKPNTWYQLVDGEFTEVQNIKTKEENE